MTRVLHGIYDHGMVEITDSDLPDIRAEAQVILKYPRKAPKIINTGTVRKFKGIAAGNSISDKDEWYKQ